MLTNLEYLYILDSFLCSSLLVDGTPFVDDALNILLGEPCEGEVVARVEAEHVAAALHRLRRQEGVRRRGRHWSRRWKYGSEVVLENHGVLVLGVLFAASATVAWTEVAFGIVLGETGLLWRLRLSEPWPLGPVRGDENMFAGERVHCGMYEVNVKLRGRPDIPRRCGWVDGSNWMSAMAAGGWRRWDR